MLIDLPDPEATERAGQRLAKGLAALPGPVLVVLEGPLGAGKTTLVRGLLRGMGHEGRVRSPTFTLLEPYELAGKTVAHLDLYRLADPGELDYLGVTDLIAPGNLVLVEWPERGGDRLPAPDLRLVLDYEGAGRRLDVRAGSPAGRSLLASLLPACQ